MSTYPNGGVTNVPAAHPITIPTTTAHNNTVPVQPSSPLAATNAPLPNPAGVPGEINADGEHDDSEYQHSHMPLETRELTSTEELWLQHAIEGNLDGLQSLVGRVDVDCCDQWGSTALMHACHRKHVSCVNFLLGSGANINKQDYRGITCLMEASWNKHIDMVRLLLRAHADVNLLDERDYTALMQAAEEGHANVVQLLIEAGADLNVQEKKRNYTALMWAVVEGHPSVVQYLVTAGTDLNIQDKYGFTALMQAARTRFIAAVLLLVGNGADLDIKDKKGRSVFDLGNQQVLQAIDKGKRDLRRRFLQIFQNDRFISQLQSEVIGVITSYLVNA